MEALFFDMIFEDYDILQSGIVFVVNLIALIVPDQVPNNFNIKMMKKLFSRSVSSLMSYDYGVGLQPMKGEHISERLRNITKLHPKNEYIVSCD